MDSKDPYLAGNEYIEWLKERGCDPRTKRLIASDGLDVDSILGLHAYFGGSIRNNTDVSEFRDATDFFDPQKWLPLPRIRFSAGWGTYLTNDFRDCNPRCDDSFDPVSLVCKLSEVNGRPAVKLSDNYRKAMGPPAEIERYRRIFGTAGVSNVPVTV
jgi:nicotinate phosphoribosyltransferase